MYNKYLFFYKKFQEESKILAELDNAEELTFPQAATKLKNLKGFYFSKNKISDETFKKLARYNNDYSNDFELDINDNYVIFKIKSEDYTISVRTHKIVSPEEGYYKKYNIESYGTLLFSVINNEGIIIVHVPY